MAFAFYFCFMMTYVLSLFDFLKPIYPRINIALSLSCTHIPLVISLLFGGVQRGKKADSGFSCWCSVPSLSTWDDPKRVFANLGPRESCTLVAPAGCPRASERAPEPVPAAGSGLDPLRPARAGAGGRVPDPGAGGPATRRAPLWLRALRATGPCALGRKVLRAPSGAVRGPGR